MNVWSFFPSIFSSERYQGDHSVTLVRERKIINTIELVYVLMYIAYIYVTQQRNKTLNSGLRTLPK